MFKDFYNASASVETAQVHFVVCAALIKWQIVSPLAFAQFFICTHAIETYTLLMRYPLFTTQRSYITNWGLLFALPPNMCILYQFPHINPCHMAYQYIYLHPPTSRLLFVFKYISVCV